MSTFHSTTIQAAQITGTLFVTMRHASSRWRLDHGDLDMWALDITDEPKPPDTEKSARHNPLGPRLRLQSHCLTHSPHFPPEARLERNGTTPNPQLQSNALSGLRSMARLSCALTLVMDPFLPVPGMAALMSKSRHLIRDARAQRLFVRLLR